MNCHSDNSKARALISTRDDCGVSPSESNVAQDGNMRWPAEAVMYYCLCRTSMQLMKEEENSVLHFFPYSLQDSFVSQYIQQHVYWPETIGWLFYFTFNFCFILKYSSLTMLCRFQVYGQVIQLYIYMHLFFIKFFSHLKITISQLLHGIEQSSLCYTIGPCWFSILSFLLEL